ncbi:MAG: hypothetical protein K8R23_12525 [Chthoniobacter sp.]|nr:hypothetical protein [Chthoniobacter sp.]
MGGKVIVIVRVIVAGVFLVAGVMKIWDFEHARSATPDFTIAIQQYRMLPWPDLTVALAVYLPWLEVTAALALFVRRFALGAATAVLGMSAMFVVAIGSAWWRGLVLDCGCFGKGRAPTDLRLHLLAGAVLLAVAAALIVHEWRRARRD